MVFKKRETEIQIKWKYGKGKKYREVKRNRKREIERAREREGETALELERQRGVSTHTPHMLISSLCSWSGPESNCKPTASHF